MRGGRGSMLAGAVVSNGKRSYSGRGSVPSKVPFSPPPLRMHLFCSSFPLLSFPSALASPLPITFHTSRSLSPPASHSLPSLLPLFLSPFLVTPLLSLFIRQTKTGLLLVMAASVFYGSAIAPRRDRHQHHHRSHFSSAAPPPLHRDFSLIPRRRQPRP